MPFSVNEVDNTGGQKNRLPRHPISRPVLLHSTRHNVQTKVPQAPCLEQPKAAMVNSQHLSRENLLCSPEHRGNSWPAVSNPECFMDASTPSKLQDLEEEASATATEANELRKQLQEMKLQMAEIVAHSAILIHDMQMAASEEIAKCLSQQQMPNVLQKGWKKDEVAFDKGLPFAQMEQQLVDCRLQLAELESQLRSVTTEKETLEVFLRSFVHTSLKLQKILLDQKIVFVLEQLVMEERIRNEAAVLVQSAKDECAILQNQLNEALVSKSEAERSLNSCIQLLREAQEELVTLQISPKQELFPCDLLELEKSQQLRHAEEQHSWRNKENLPMLETSIKWTVLECVWQGAVESLLTQSNSEISHDDDNFGSHTENRGRCCTVDLIKEKEGTPRLQMKRRFLSEETTPLKEWSLFVTPKSAFPIGDGNSKCLITTPERTTYLQREVALRENLVKSEYEVEILGDKVVEFKIVLEKVALLLDCISKSSAAGRGTKFLLRRIIEQLQKFKDENLEVEASDMQSYCCQYPQCIFFGPC